MTHFNQYGMEALAKAIAAEAFYRLHIQRYHGCRLLAAAITAAIKGKQ